MAVTKKGLGRGLSALIPDSDMEFLSRVARGDESLSVALPAEAFQNQSETKGESTIGGADATNHSLANKAGKTPKRSADTLISSEDSRAHSSLEQSEVVSEVVSGDNPVLLDVVLIEANPYQPRRVFAPEEMQDLVASVREHGIIQPILVRPKSGDSWHYQLIAGERRWRAAQAAGLAKVPVVIRDVSDQQALELALIENVQRHDISVMDAARAYRRLSQEFTLSQDDIARRVGKSRPSIANTMRLLDLPEEAQKAIEDGLMTEGHGRAILLAPGDGARRAVFRRIVRDKVTVREAEELARRAQSISSEDPAATNLTAKDAANAAKGARLSGAELRALRVTEEELSKVLGTRVRIRPRAKGGQISIEYFSGDDLDQLLGRLRKASS